MKIHIYLIALIFAFFPTTKVSAVTTVHQDSYSTTTSIFSKDNHKDKKKPKKKRRRKKDGDDMERTTKIFRTIFFTTSATTLLGIIMYIGGLLVSFSAQSDAGFVVAIIGIFLFYISGLLSLIFGALWLAFWVASQNS